MCGNAARLSTAFAIGWCFSWSFAVQCFIGRMDTMFDDLILVLLRLCLVEWCVICSYICDSELVQQNGRRYKRIQTEKTTNKKWSHVKIQWIIDFGSVHETEICIDIERKQHMCIVYEGVMIACVVTDGREEEAVLCGVVLFCCVIG